MHPLQPCIVLYDISQLLNTQLDRETLATCVGMIESGVNPEALAVCEFQDVRIGFMLKRRDRPSSRSSEERKLHLVREQMRRARAYDLAGV